MMRRILGRAGEWLLPWLIGVGLLAMAVLPSRAEAPAPGTATAGATAAGTVSGEASVAPTEPVELPNLYDADLVPRKVRKIIFRAAAYGKRNEPQKAVDLLAEHLRDHPDQDHHLVRLHLAQNLSDLDRTGEAMGQYRRAVELEPRLDRAWFGLADAAYDLERFDEAGEAFHEGYKVSPERPVEVLYYAAAAYLQADAPARAVPLLQQLCSGRLGALDLKWFQALVAAANKLEQPGLAQADVARMLEFFPNDPEAWYLKYQYEASRRDFASAAVALRVVGYLRPLTAAEQKQLGDLFLVIGTPHLASVHYEEGLVEGDPAEFERLASALVAAHETEKALAVLADALENEPTTRLWSLLGDIHYLRQEYAEALDAFARVSAAGDDTGRAFLMQGYCALELGRREQALDLLARASNFPEQADLAQMLIQRALRLADG